MYFIFQFKMSEVQILGVNGEPICNLTTADGSTVNAADGSTVNAADGSAVKKVYNSNSNILFNKLPAEKCILTSTWEEVGMARCKDFGSGHHNHM